MATKMDEGPEPKSFEEYFTEIKDIEKSRGQREPGAHGSDEDLSKPPDGMTSTISLFSTFSFSVILLLH